VGRDRRPATNDELLNFGANTRGFDAERFKRCSDGFGSLGEREKNVFGTDVFVVKAASLMFG
jgi:hypothetical protein